MVVIIELDGMLWKPVPGATASAEEFEQARSLIVEIHALEAWSPWVAEDRASEYEAAVGVFKQWTRAEPWFRKKTHEELQAEHEQWLAGLDARVKAETARRQREQAARAASHDPERAQARLALLEQQAVLADTTRERDEIAAHELFPAMPEDAREQKLAGLEQTIATAKANVRQLAERVGDMEAVADDYGRLPAERRELALQIFAADRVTEVRKLRGQVASQQAELKAAKGRTERTRIRETLSKNTDRLEFLEQIPPMTAADMCSECVTPASWHGFRFEISAANPHCGPCPAWPRWGQRLQKAREILMTAAAKPTDPPSPPKPQPLAIIPSGLPIEEVIARLTAEQAK